MFNLRLWGNKSIKIQISTNYIFFFSKPQPTTLKAYLIALVLFMGHEKDEALGIIICMAIFKLIILIINKIIIFLVYSIYFPTNKVKKES
jgi:hypothetical protein